MNRNIVFLIFIISIFLYILAPNYVDKSYCALCLAFYLVEVFIVLKIDLKSKLYIGFNTLFFLSFFLTSFAYPLFVYDTPADLLGNIEKNINFNYLSKCSALCLLASSIYCCGYLQAIKRNKCEKYGDQYLHFTSGFEQLGFIKGLYFVIFFVLFIVAFLFVRRGGSVALEGGDLLSALFEAIFPVVLLINTVKTKPKNLIEFIKHNMIILLFCFIMMALFIRIGDRGLVLTCGVEMLFIYTLCIKRLKITHVGVIMLIMMILMFSIRQLRMSDDYAKSSSAISSLSDFASSDLSEYGVEYGVWFYFSDLTNISHELCLGYEYRQSHELFYPLEEVVLTFISPIPFLPSLFCNYILGKPTSEFVTGEALNKYMSGYGHANFGNHCVIDVFMMWGIIGVLIVFYFFGFCVAKCYNKLFNSLIYAALYVMLVSYAIYVPRNIVLSLIRPAVYICFFVWLSSNNIRISNQVKNID